MNEEVSAADGRTCGPWVRPRNVSSNMAGSIHEEHTAKALGMAGALVTGRTLVVAFVPLLVGAFGSRWFERGTLSIEFRSGVLDQEEVRAVIAKPPAGPDSQASAWIERHSGEVVARGTVSAGSPVEPTWLATIDPMQFAESEFQVVHPLAPGDRFPDVSVTPSLAQAQRWDSALPSLPWFSEASPWGGPIASPALVTTALTAGCTAYRNERPIAGVAVDGAIELRNIAGPVFLNQTYRVTGGVIGRGSSPRTEYIWYESALDAEDGRRVAEMRMKLRFMKGSASLLAPARAAGGR